MHEDSADGGFKLFTQLTIGQKTGAKFNQAFLLGDIMESWSTVTSTDSDV